MNLWLVKESCNGNINNKYTVMSTVSQSKNHAQTSLKFLLLSCVLIYMNVAGAKKERSICAICINIFDMIRYIYGKSKITVYFHKKRARGLKLTDMII
jgi:hypothetical protein